MATPGRRTPVHQGEQVGSVQRPRSIGLVGGAKTCVQFALVLIAPAMEDMVFLTPEDLRALPDPEWVVQGILPLNSLAVLYGEPGKGKTFVALSIALSVATGQKWFDRKTAHGSVLYVAAEGLVGIRDRADAFYQHTGKEGGLITYTPTTFNLRNPD